MLSLVVLYLCNSKRVSFQFPLCPRIRSVGGRSEKFGVQKVIERLNDLNRAN